jgi:hypothetical protein
VQRRATRLPGGTRPSSSSHLQTCCAPTDRNDPGIATRIDPAGGRGGRRGNSPRPPRYPAWSFASPGPEAVWAPLAGCWNCGTRVKMPVGYHRDVCIALRRRPLTLSRRRICLKPSAERSSPARQPCRPSRFKSQCG